MLGGCKEICIFYISHKTQNRPRFCAISVSVSVSCSFAMPLCLPSFSFFFHCSAVVVVVVVFCVWSSSSHAYPQYRFVCSVHLYTNRAVSVKALNKCDRSVYLLFLSMHPHKCCQRIVRMWKRIICNQMNERKSGRASCSKHENHRTQN